MNLTGVYGLPDAVLVPSIGVSGGQWVKPNAGQLVQTADGLRLVVVTPPAWRIGSAGLVDRFGHGPNVRQPTRATLLPICWLADRDQRAV